ncbi:MAG: FAD-dependent oxidoreductase, partial [Patescibacteria group bacterium]
MYDLIIIGGGPAAISAGIYAARKKLKTLLITKGWGGQLNSAPWIENYPGFDSISGMDLSNKLISHLKKNTLDIKEGFDIKEIKVEKKNKIIRVRGKKIDFRAKAVIVTTGRVPKKLGIFNEEKFIGKGISYCATCDAPMFQGKKVAVVGGANAGLGIALELSAFASKIYILEFLPELNADEYLQEKVKKSSKINIITSALIKEFKGDKFIEGLIYQDNISKKEKTLKVEGIFIAIGSSANFSLVKNVVKLNKQNEIKIDSKNRTSQLNIFAAGDVTDVSHKQVIIA